MWCCHSGFTLGRCPHAPVTDTHYKLDACRTLHISQLTLLKLLSYEDMSDAVHINLNLPCFACAAVNSARAAELRGCE